MSQIFDPEVSREIKLGYDTNMSNIFLQCIIHCSYLMFDSGKIYVHIMAIFIIVSIFKGTPWDETFLMLSILKIQLI